MTARVYFQQDAGANFDPELNIDPITGYPEECADGTLGVTCATSDEIYNYGWSMFGSLPDTSDAGLVILDQPIELPEYGALAAAGTLDELATQRGQQDLTFTASGYGVTKTNPVTLVTFRERLMAETRLTNLRSHLNDGFNVQTNGNGPGRGGTCSGDSGGPLFYGDSDEQPDRRRHVLRDEHLVPGCGLLVPDRPSGRARPGSLTPSATTPGRRSEIVG